MAVSVDGLDTSRDLARRLALEFDVLSDHRRIALAAWGLREPGARDIFRPATYVIDVGGTIRFAAIGDSPRDRPDLAEIERALDGAGPRPSP